MRLSLEKIPLRKMFAYPSQKKKKRTQNTFIDIIFASTEVFKGGNYRIAEATFRE